MIALAIIWVGFASFFIGYALGASKSNTSTGGGHER